MNDRQSRKLNAAAAGQSVMDEPLHIPIWSGQAAVALKKTAMDNSIINIGKIDDKINDTTGNATSKSAAKETAAKTAWQVAKAVAAFADDTGDDVLRNEVNFPWTELRYVKDAIAVDRWQVIQNRANANAAALTAGGYGVDLVMIALLQTQIDEFKNWKGKPKAAIADKKALNQSLTDEFDNLDKIIGSLKERLVQFAVSQKDFYNAALDAFEMDDTGIRHNAIRFVFVDDATGIRLPNVKTLLVEKSLERKSSKLGVSTFSQQETPQGNYSAESSLPGYTKVVSSNIGVEAGKMTKLIVTLVKL